MRALLRLCSILVATVGTLGGCTAPGLALTAVGIATDTSITWDIAKHVHGQLTADDPTPCAQLNSVQRALNPRCEYAPARIDPAELASAGLQDCPLTAATRDARLWRALPALIDAGASPERCARSPLQDLAEVDACPDFAAASPAALRSLAWLAESDTRAIRHDVFRMLSCPNARAAGLDRILVGWLDRGLLEPGTLSFSPLGALHPDLLVGRFGRELQTAGHLPTRALDPFTGSLPSGFEEALRTSHWAALQWWLFEVPQLANQAPPTRGAQLAWIPLQRVIVPGFLPDADAQRAMVAFLLDHGADPKKRLPFDSGKTVLTYAASIRSPLVSMLEPPVPMSPTALARNDAPAALRELARRTTR